MMSMTVSARRFWRRIRPPRWGGDAPYVHGRVARAKRAQRRRQRRATRMAVAAARYEELPTLRLVTAWDLG